MKRRVAGLPPVTITLFNQKVLDRKAETSIMTSPRGSVCEVCKSVVLVFKPVPYSQLNLILSQ